MATESDPFELASLGLSVEEAQARFDRLQSRLAPLWGTISELNAAEQTIVVVPSISLEFELRGSELQAYEERFLFLLLLLRQPRARLVYVTSQEIRPSVVDYYLGLLPGVIVSHARERLFLVSPQDADSIPLTKKILLRPRLIEQIRSLIHDPVRAHLVPFNTSVLERDLALRLGIPMYGADPKYDPLGTKTGCRRLFAEAGIRYPVGFEDLNDLEEVVDAIQELLVIRPEVASVIVKQNAGVSGAGNATVDLAGLGPSPSKGAILERVRALDLEDASAGFEGFFERFGRQGGIVEERIIADEMRSPSVQLRVVPGGEVELLSTHDQLLGGPSGQSYMGCRFPADDGYASLIAAEALRVGELVAREGVLGRFAIDFLVSREGDEWASHAIEINLRKGGTTHPYLTLQFLTDGAYDAETNRFHTPAGHRKCFVATDHAESPAYRAFTPEDVFDVAVRHGLHFDQTHERGVVFHMMAALGECGRLGFTAVGGDPAEAEEIHQRTLRVLDAEAAAALTPRPLPE